MNFTAPVLIVDGFIGATLPVVVKGNSASSTELQFCEGQDSAETINESEVNNDLSFIITGSYYSLA